MTEWDKKQSEARGNDRERTLDDFWDVEALLPQRPARKPVPSSSKSIETVELELPAPPSKAAPKDLKPSEPIRSEPLTARQTEGEPARLAGSSVHYVPPHRAEEGGKDAPLLEYEPEGVLLHRVKVYGWEGGYHYFDQFAKDAERYDAMKAPASAAKESFFSYFPQYVQLGRRATAWYLFWREHVRHGQYPDTDYSYVLLYLFELINLPADEPSVARARRELMANVWMAYRRAYPQMDHYMCEWLCDYCLIHALPAPVDLLAPALDEIIMGSRLKEFYLSSAVRVSSPSADGVDTSLETARILLRHCCQYDYRKSKFAQGEHKGLFDSTIPAAVAHALPLLLGADGRKPAITLLDSTVTRDAYVGALCSYQNKRRIEVDYTSFSRSHELRFLIGDMVKHVENRLRAWIGVRSRLSVMSLPVPLRDDLDAYLAPLEPPKSAIPTVKREQPRPAYEAMYDLPRKEVSLKDAAAIEARSWETTKILVEAFGDADEAENEVPLCGNEVAACAADEVAPAAPLEENGESGENVSNRDAPAWAPFTPFIKAALAGDLTALRAAAKALGKMPDALADEINALTADSDIGDIVLEDDGTGRYTVIEDYRDAVAEMIKD